MIQNWVPDKNVRDNERPHEISDSYPVSIADHIRLNNACQKNNDKMSNIIQKMTKLWRETRKTFARLYYFLPACKAGISSKTFANFELHRNTIHIDNTGKVVLPYVEIDIVIGCNLKCEQCAHLSPFRKGIVPANDVIHWFRLWSEKITPKKLNLLGGEPLLHTDLARILRETKKIWPQTEIELVTNGLMFSKVSSDVFDALEETRIHVIISNHSSCESDQQMFDEAISRVRNHSFDYKIRKSHQKWMVQYDKTPDGTPTMFSSPPKAAWEVCLSKTCISLVNNKLYKCAVLASIHEGVSENALPAENWSHAFTYKPLTLDASGEEIVEHLSRRQVPACAICPNKKILVEPQQIKRKFTDLSINCEQEPINLCMACDDHYAQHAAALVASIIDNKSEEDHLRFFILSDKLSEKVKQKFRDMANQWNFSLTFLECTDDLFQGLPTWRGKYNAYFRLAMHRLLPKDISKVIYLDCDTLVTTSLVPLFHTEISDRYAAVVATNRDSGFTTHDSPYFNSGMVLFNLEKFRTDDIERKAIELGIRRFSEIEFPDQDLLNELFAGNVVFLPLKWNTILFPDYYHRFTKISGQTPAFSIDELKTAISDMGIIHFAGFRPWRAFCEHPHRNLYWKYIRLTPFYREAAQRYRIGWMNAFYQRYFRIKLSKKNVHVKLFGINAIQWRPVGKKMV